MPYHYLLTELDGRVLQATSPRGRSVTLIAAVAGCRPDTALSTLHRLRSRGLVDPVTDRRIRRWTRTGTGLDALAAIRPQSEPRRSGYRGS